MSNPLEEKWYDPILHWTIHILVAIFMFTVIAFAAYALHLLVHWMEEHKLEANLVTALRWLTYFLMFLDILTFVVYSVRTTVKFLRK